MAARNTVVKEWLLLILSGLLESVRSTWRFGGGKDDASQAAGRIVREPADDH